MFKMNKKEKGCSINSADNYNETVNHPPHYTWLKEKCGVEVIDITRHFDFSTGNALKYLLRAGHKSDSALSDVEKEIEDLKKADWYINDRIMQLQKSLDETIN